MDEDRLRSLLHRVRAWALEVEDAAALILEECSKGGAPTTPDDTGTTLVGPPSAASQSTGSQPGGWSEMQRRAARHFKV